MADHVSPHGLARDALEAAFRRAVEAALERVRQGRSAPVFTRAESGPLDRLRHIPREGRPIDEVVDDLLADVFPRGMRTDHPRFFAFIPSPASPLSWLGDLLTSIHNAHAGAAVQSEGATGIERGLIRFLCEEAGLPETAGGLFVSGGSMANLAALCVARDRMLAEDERGLGVVYVTRETHASVSKALRILGFLDRQIGVVAVDDQQRMDVTALARAVATDKLAGRRPFAVVASAGTTSTGAIDPLGALADLCASETLWLHVDGAYGASALLSPAHKPLLAGVERADSLAWDAHKWLFQTYGCGVVLLRDRSLLAPSFSLSSDYLRDGDAEGVEPNYWDLGPELTRPARAIRLWLTLQAVGCDGMAAAIAHGFELAEAAERAVRATPGWEIVSPARMAITAFRFASEGLSPEDADDANAVAARRMMEDGFAMVGTTRVGDRLALRICTIHPQATETDLEETIRRLDGFAREAAAAMAGAPSPAPRRRSGTKKGRFV